MTIQDFITTAIEGGYRKHSDLLLNIERCFQVSPWQLLPEVALHAVFLDPEAWKAVGKVKGWIDEEGNDIAKYYNNDPKRTPYPLSLWYMHKMIDALWEGKTLEEYIATL